MPLVRDPILRTTGLKHKSSPRVLPEYMNLFLKFFNPTRKLAHSSFGLLFMGTKTSSGLSVSISDFLLSPIQKFK